MAKFIVSLEMELDAKDVDDAITKAAIFMAINASAKRPLLRTPGLGLNFNQTVEHNLLEGMQKALFKKGDQVKDVYIEAVPKDTWPAPEMTM